MPAAPEPKQQLDLRRVRFGTFVARVLDAAAARGMTIPQIEEKTGLGNSTFYGWRKGEWKRDPVPARVRAFCEGLGASIDEAYRALGWELNEPGKRVAPEPIEDPDIRLLMRKLSSPKTTAAEKLLIRRTIRALVGQPEDK